MKLIFMLYWKYCAEKGTRAQCKWFEAKGFVLFACLFVFCHLGNCSGVKACDKYVYLTTIIRPTKKLNRLDYIENELIFSPGRHFKGGSIFNLNLLPFESPFVVVRLLFGFFCFGFLNQRILEYRGLYKITKRAKFLMEKKMILLVKK